MRLGAGALAGAVGVIAWLAPAQALAHGPVPPGVHIDPGSPANKQYQIPIPAARQETSGSTGSGNASSPPLFGVGITSGSVASSGGGTTSHARATTSSAEHQSSHPSQAQSDGRSPSGRTRRRAPRPAASSSGRRGAANAPVSAYEKAGQPGSNSWLPLVLGGALVLILGGGGGLGLRRRYLQG